jgi:hypothetical protein
MWSAATTLSQITEQTDTHRRRASRRLDGEPGPDFVAVAVDVGHALFKQLASLGLRDDRQIGVEVTRPR